MPSNDYDQAARYAAKLEAEPFLRWLFPRLDPALGFTGWLDTRTLPFPGEPDRVCDTVAGFRHAGDPNRVWASVIEFQAQPQEDMLDRLLEYLARSRRELRDPVSGTKYQVTAALLNLTGPSQPSELVIDLPGESGVGLRLGVKVLTLSEEDAAATLARIDRGDLGRGILPWIPLMRGGGEAAIIDEWKRIALTEPDARRRIDYARLALVLSGLPKVWGAWHLALEGWNMERAPAIVHWENLGRIAAKRDDLLRLLRFRFKDDVSQDLAATVQTMKELDTLDRWFDLAMTTASLQDFLQAVER